MDIQYFEDALAFEDTPDILDFKTPDFDFILWPYIRYQVLGNIIEKIGNNKILYGFDKLSSSSINKYKLFIKEIIPTFLSTDIRERNILIFSSHRNAYFKEYQGRYCNIYTEPFVWEQRDRTLVLHNTLEPPLDRGYKKGEIKRVGSVSLLTNKLSKFSSPYKKRMQIIASNFVKFLQNRCTNMKICFDNNFWKNIYQQCVYLGCYAKYNYLIYKFILKQINLKLLILDGCLQGSQGHLIQLAKQLGATVADKQHGIIFRQHLTYNWAPALCHDERLYTQIPELFLSFGKYWHDKMRLPVKKCIPIGNPWFSIQQKRTNNETNTQGILIAVPSDSNSSLDAIQNLRIGIPKNIPIYLRPHPAQRQMFCNHPISKIKDVLIDDKTDIYESFSRINIFICWDVTTAMFEAAALKKRVFVYNNYRTKEQPFEKFSSVDELLAKINNPECGIVDTSLRENFFAPDWELNYKNLLESLYIK